MHCPFHPPWLDQPNYTWRNIQVIKLLITQFFQPPITSSLFGPSILLLTLLSTTLSLRSSVSVRNEVSHLYRTPGKIIVFCILNFTFIDSTREDKISDLERLRRMDVLKLSRAINHVNVERKTNVSESTVFIIRVDDRHWWWKRSMSLIRWFFFQHWHCWSPEKFSIRESKIFWSEQ
jgi:hypothetical protein